MERLILRPLDPGAWRQFVRIYGPHILQWARQQGLQNADAHDFTQDVLLRFWRGVERFRYDPSKRFRSYLGQLMRWVLTDWKEQTTQSLVGSGDTKILKLLQQATARDDLAGRIEELYDLELLRKAMRDVRRRVAPRTWEAFRLQAVEGLTLRETSARLDMKIGTAGWARSSVLSMIRATVRQLDSLETPHEPVSR